MLGNIPPPPNIPKDMEQRFERAVLQGFSTDISPLVSCLEIDSMIKQPNIEYGFFEHLIYSYRVNPNWICLIRGGKNRHGYKMLFWYSLFIESLLLLWISWKRW